MPDIYEIYRSIENVRQEACMVYPALWNMVKGTFLTRLRSWGQ